MATAAATWAAGPRTRSELEFGSGVMLSPPSFGWTLPRLTGCPGEKAAFEVHAEEFSMRIFHATVDIEWFSADCLPWGPVFE